MIPRDEWEIITGIAGPSRSKELLEVDDAIDGYNNKVKTLKDVFVAICIWVYKQPLGWSLEDSVPNKENLTTVQELINELRSEFEQSYKEWRATYDQYHINKSERLKLQQDDSEKPKPLTVREFHKDKPHPRYYLECFSSSEDLEKKLTLSVSTLWCRFMGAQYCLGGWRGLPSGQHSFYKFVISRGKKLGLTPEKALEQALGQALEQTPIKRVTYYSKDTRTSEHIATFTNDRIIFPVALGLQPKDAKLQSIIFVIDGSNNIYVGKKEPGVIQHSSLRGGKPVQTAGTIQVHFTHKDASDQHMRTLGSQSHLCVSAKIYTILPSSGHYAPSIMHTVLSHKIFSDNNFSGQVKDQTQDGILFE